MLLMFLLKLQDAFSNHLFIFASLVLMISFMLVFIYRRFTLKFNQIDRQLHGRLNKSRSKGNNNFLDNFSLFLDTYFSKVSENINLQLDRANVIFTDKEYHMFMLSGMAIGAIVGFVLYPLGPVWNSIFSFAGSAATLFGRILIGILLTYVGYLFPRFWLFYLIHKRTKLFVEQITDCLLNFADAQKSGYNIPETVKMIGEDMPYPMGTEFKRTYTESQAGKSLKSSLLSLKKRVNLKDFSMAIDAIVIQYDKGGQLDKLLRSMVNIIQKRLELKKEIQKQIAGSKMTGYVLLAAPILFLVVFSFLNKNEYLQMLHTPLGLIMIVLAIVCYLVAAAIITYILYDISKEI